MQTIKKALCVALIAASAGAQAGTTVFEGESFLAGASNDTIATAQNLGSLLNGTDLTVVGARNDLPGGSSVDYFAFNTSSTLNFAFTVTAPNGHLNQDDPIVGLFNSAGTRIAYDDDGSSGFNSLLKQTLSAGTYYVAVSGYPNFNFQGNSGDTGWMYGLNITATAAPVPEPESYAMFLAGLGLLGAVARRRKSA